MKRSTLGAMMKRPSTLPGGESLEHLERPLGSVWTETAKYVDLVPFPPGRAAIVLASPGHDE